MDETKSPAPSPGVQVQMLAVGPEDDEMYDFDPKQDLEVFKASFKRHTHFAFDEATYPIAKSISYKDTTECYLEIPENKDMFISNMYIHINVERFLRSGTDINGTNIPYYIKNNLGIRCIKRIRIKTSKLTLLDVDTDGLYILLHSFRNDSEFKAMMGNYNVQNPKLITKIISPHLYVPVPLWYSKNHKEMFPMCLLKDHLRVHIEFEKGLELIEENPDEDFNIKILLVPDASGDVKLDMTVEYPNTDEHAKYSYEGEYTSPYVAELIVNYVIPTETELEMIQSAENIEHVVPNIMKIEDPVGLTHREGNAPGTATLTMRTVPQSVKMFFIVVKNEIDGVVESLAFDKIDTCHINDKEFLPEFLQYLSPYKHNYVSLNGVYSYSFSLEPCSSHPSGHVYFGGEDSVKITTSTDGDDAYSNRHASTYVIFNNVYRFSGGDMIQIFM